MAVGDVRKYTDSLGLSLITNWVHSRNMEHAKDPQKPAYCFDFDEGYFWLRRIR
jgi:hypothetical protein